MFQFNRMVSAIACIDLVQCLDFFKHRNKFLALFNGLCESNCTAHWLWIIRKIVFLSGKMRLLCQTIHTANNFNSVIKGQFVVVVRQLLLQRAADKFFIHRQYNYFVVRQKSLQHRIRKTQPIKFRAINIFIIHGAEQSTVVLCFLLAGICIDSRRRRHIQAFFRTNILVIMDTDKVTVIFSRQRHARRAVSLIANYKVKLYTGFLLKIMDNVDTLIGGKE